MNTNDDCQWTEENRRLMWKCAESDGNQKVSGYCGSPDSSTLLEAEVTANTEATLPHFWEVLVLLLSNSCLETCRIIFTVEK